MCKIILYILQEVTNFLKTFENKSFFVELFFSLIMGVFCIIYDYSIFICLIIRSPTKVFTRQYETGKHKKEIQPCLTIEESLFRNNTELRLLLILVLGKPGLLVTIAKYPIFYLAALFCYKPL